MDFFLKFLIFGGKYLSEIATKSLLLAYRRSIDTNKKELSIKCREALNNGGKNILSASNHVVNESKNLHTQHQPLKYNACRLRAEDTRSREEETTNSNIFGRFNVIEEQFNQLESDIKSQSISCHQSVDEMIRKSKNRTTSQEILEKTTKANIFEQYYWNDGNSNTMLSEGSPQINKIPFDKAIPKEQKHANASAKMDQLILLQNARKASPFSRHAFPTLGKKEIAMSGESPSIKAETLCFKKEENSKFNKTVRPIKLKNGEQQQVGKELYKLGPQSLVTKYSRSCVQGLYFQGGKLVQHNLNEKEDREYITTKSKRNGSPALSKHLEIVTQNHSYPDVPKINELDYLTRFDEHLDSILENERIEREIEGERLFRNRKAFENLEIKLNHETFWKRVEQIDTKNFCLENIYIFDHNEEMLQKNKMLAMAEDAKKESAFVLKISEVFSVFEDRLEATLFKESMTRRYFDEKLLEVNIRAFNYFECEIKDQEFSRRVNKINITDSSYSQSYRSYKKLEADNLNTKAQESLKLGRKLPDKYLHVTKWNGMESNEDLIDINMRVFQEMERNMSVVKILNKSKVHLPIEPTTSTKKPMFRPLSPVIRVWKENTQKKLVDSGELSRPYSTEKISRNTYGESKQKSKSLYFNKFPHFSTDLTSYNILTNNNNRQKRRSSQSSAAAVTLVDEINFENVEEMDVRIPNLNKTLPTIKSSRKKSITSAQKVNMLKSKIGPNKFQNNFNQAIANENLKKYLEKLEQMQLEKEKVGKEKKSLLSTFENKKESSLVVNQITANKNDVKQTRLKENADLHKKVSTRPIKTVQNSKTESKKIDFQIPQKKSIELIRASQNNISLKRFIPPSPTVNLVKHNKSISQEDTKKIYKEENQNGIKMLSDMIKPEEFNEIVEILSTESEKPLKYIGSQYIKSLSFKSEPKINSNESNLCPNVDSKPNQVNVKVSNISEDTNVVSKKNVENKTNKEKLEDLDFTNIAEEGNPQNVNATKILLAYDYITKNLNQQEKAELKVALGIRDTQVFGKNNEGIKPKKKISNKLGTKALNVSSIKKLYSDFYSNDLGFVGSPRTKDRAVQEVKPKNVVEADKSFLGESPITIKETVPETKYKRVVQANTSSLGGNLRKKLVFNEAEMKNNQFEANKVLQKVKNTKGNKQNVGSPKANFDINESLERYDVGNKKNGVKDDFNRPSKTQFGSLFRENTEYQKRTPPVKYLINMKDNNEDFFDCSKTVYEMTDSFEEEDKSNFESLYIGEHEDMNRKFGNFDDVFYCLKKDFEILRSTDLKGLSNSLPEEDNFGCKSKSEEILEAISDCNIITSSKLNNECDESQEKMGKSDLTDITSIEASKVNAISESNENKNPQDYVINNTDEDVYKLDRNKELEFSNNSLLVIPEITNNQTNDNNEYESSTSKNNYLPSDDFTNLNHVEFKSNLEDVYCAMTENKPKMFRRYQEKTKIPSSNLNNNNVRSYKNAANFKNIKEVVYVTNNNDKPKNINHISTKKQSMLRQPINWSTKDKNEVASTNTSTNNIEEIVTKNENVASNELKEHEILTQSHNEPQNIEKSANNTDDFKNRSNSDVCDFTDVKKNAKFSEEESPNLNINHTVIAEDVSTSNKNECTSLEENKEKLKEDFSPSKQDSTSNEIIVKADNDLISATAHNDISENCGQRFNDIEEYWNWIVSRDNLGDQEFNCSNKTKLVTAAASKHEELNMKNREDSEFVVNPRESSEKVLTATTSQDKELNFKNSKDLPPSSLKLEKNNVSNRKETELINPQRASDELLIPVSTEPIKKIGSLQSTCKSLTLFIKSLASKPFSTVFKETLPMESKSIKLLSENEDESINQNSTSVETKNIKLSESGGTDNNAKLAKICETYKEKDVTVLEQSILTKPINDKIDKKENILANPIHDEVNVEETILTTNDKVVVGESILRKPRNDNEFIVESFLPKQENDKMLTQPTNDNVMKQKNDIILIEETTIPKPTNVKAIKQKNDKIIIEEVQLRKPTDEKVAESKNDDIIIVEAKLLPKQINDNVVKPKNAKEEMILTKPANDLTKEEAKLLPKRINDNVVKAKNDKEGMILTKPANDLAKEEAKLLPKRINDKVVKPKNDKEETILTKPTNDLAKEEQAITENGKVNLIPNIQQPEIKELNITENIFKKKITDKNEEIVDPTIEVNKTEMLDIESKLDSAVPTFEKNCLHSEPFIILEDADPSIEHFIRIKDLPNLCDLETKYYLDQSLITSSSYEPSFFNKLNKVEALELDDQTDVCKPPIINIKSNSSKVFQYSGPVKILQKSLWNWEENQKPSLPPATNPQPKKATTVKKEINKTNKELKEPKKYRYEEKETKSIFGTTTMVTYLVEDNK